MRKYLISVIDKNNDSNLIANVIWASSPNNAIKQFNSINNECHIEDIDMDYYDDMDTNNIGDSRYDGVLTEFFSDDEYIFTSGTDVLVIPLEEILDMTRDNIGVDDENSLRDYAKFLLGAAVYGEASHTEKMYHVGLLKIKHVTVVR